MKKLILPLVLLFAIGMLAAVESDPSDVVGYVKYDLVVGNNTLALPMVEAYTMASGVGNAITGCDAVRYFNAAATPQVWVAAAKTPFGTWNGDFAVVNGDPLWINTTTAGTFYSIGDLPASPLPAYTLYVGNNFIMVPLDKSALNMASLVGNDIPGCDAVRYFNAAATPQVWVAAAKTPFGTWNGDFATAIADPLWINTTTAGTWPAASRSAENFGTPSK